MAETAFPPPLSEIVENLEFLDDWNDRFEYLLDLGKRLPGLPEAEQVEENLVRGCQARVWLVAEPGAAKAEGRRPLVLRAMSDAHMVNGLIAVLLSFYAGHDLESARTADPLPVLRELGLEEHLSPTRRNGLHSMIRRIQSLCEAHARTQP